MRREHPARARIGSSATSSPDLPRAGGPPPADDGLGGANRSRSESRVSACRRPNNVSPPRGGPRSQTVSLPGSSAVRRRPSEWSFPRCTSNPAALAAPPPPPSPRPPSYCRPVGSGARRTQPLPGVRGSSGGIARHPNEEVALPHIGSIVHGLGGLVVGCCPSVHLRRIAVRELSARDQVVRDEA